MMRRAISFLVAVILALAPISGCQNRQELTFAQLISNLQRYNQKEVTVEGFYFDSFEFMRLCDGLEISIQFPDALTPEGEVIWINGGIPSDIYDKLYVQKVSAYTQHYGKITVIGKFEYGGRYGHLGGFKYQITSETVELLPPLE